MLILTPRTTEYSDLKTKLTFPSLKHTLWETGSYLPKLIIRISYDPAVPHPWCMYLAEICSCLSKEKLKNVHSSTSHKREPQPGNYPNAYQQEKRQIACTHTVEYSGEMRNEHTIATRINVMTLTNIIMSERSQTLEHNIIPLISSSKTGKTNLAWPVRRQDSGYLLWESEQKRA